MGKIRFLILLSISLGSAFAAKAAAEDKKDTESTSLSIFENANFKIQGDALTFYQELAVDLEKQLQVFTKMEMLQEHEEGVVAPGYKTTIVQNHGILTPGFIQKNGALVPGSLTIGGDTPLRYEQTPDGELQILFNSPKSFSQVHLESQESTAEATLGGTLTIMGGPNFDVEPGQEMQIFTASSGIHGRFNYVQDIDLPSLISVVTYSDQAVTLSFSPTLHHYVGSFVEPIFTSVNRNNIFVMKQTYGLRNVFSRQAMPVSVSLLQCEADAADGTPAAIVAPPPLPVSNSHPGRFYFGPTTSAGNVNSTGTQVGFNYWSVGALAGFDYALPHAALGILFNYDGIYSHIDRSWGTYTTDALLGTLYGTYSCDLLPPLSFDALIAGGYEWNTIHRKAGTSSHPLTTTGYPDSTLLDALLSIEYTFAKSNHRWMPTHFQWMPLLSLQFINLNANSYDEAHGNNFALSIGKEHAQSLRSNVAMLFDYQLVFPTWNLRTQCDVGWQWEFLDHEGSVAFAPLNIGGPTGSITTVGAGRNTLLAGANFLFQFKEDRVALELNYDFEWNQLFYDNYLTLGVVIRW